MKDIKEYISNIVKDLLGSDKNVIVEIPPKENMGDFSVPCFTLRNEKLKNPNEVATFLQENIKDQNSIFSKIEVLGPYVNFFLDYEIFANELICDIESKQENYGSFNQGKNEALLIEHTSINPNASPHIGRSRNSMIGDFLSRLYQFTGYNVERHYFINDIGKQISMLLVGCEEYPQDNLEFSDILNLYVKINEKSKTDEKILEKVFYYLHELENGNQEIRNKFKNITDLCIEGQMKIFSKLNISWDIFTHESDFVFDNITNDILKKIDSKGKLKEDEEGRLYVDLSGYDIPTKSPVLVLTRNDKTSLYPLRDIAYTIYKINRNDKNNFIVLGEDQIVYMQQISAVLDIIGYKAPKLTSYSFVLLNGNKMATREGTVVLLEDFIEATKDKLKESFAERNLEVTENKLNIISNACIKFTMLNVSKDKVVNFNLENATSFNGESGVYILYSIVRINSILKNASNINYDIPLKFVNNIEHKLLKNLYLFGEIIDNLLKTNEPSSLTKYIFNLTQDFSKLYEEVHINNEEDLQLKNSRYRLLECTKMVLTNALSILGIDTIDKM